MSNIENKAIKDFWESAHNIENRLWLTGSNPNGLMKMYGVQMPSEKLVMDIGVGLGDFSRTMHANGNRVCAVDISEHALSKVSMYADTFITYDIAKAPQVDMAFCHLVLQHCNNNMVEFIFRNIPLKEDAVFYFQFAFLIKEENLSAQMEAITKKELLQFRNLRTILEMMGRAGLLPVEIIKPVFFPIEELIGWYLVKAKRSAVKWVPGEITLNEYAELVYTDANETIKLQFSDNSELIKALDSPAVLNYEQMLEKEGAAQNQPLSIEEDTVIVLLQQAEQYIQENRELEKAGEILKYVLELNPSSAEAFCDLGIVEYMKGDYERALEYMEKAVELDPENESFQFNKSEINKLIS